MQKPNIRLIDGGKTEEVPTQIVSTDIWDKKYRLKTKEGQAVDETVHGTYERVARALAEIEKPAARKHWFDKFCWALENGAIPAGRITSNAGAGVHKPKTSTINCTVSRTIEDSMEGIASALYDAWMTLRAGCGIGYEFSTLRPKGAPVAGAGATTSGPLSFMDVYDQMCLTISSAGGRRGAQMATFDISHPDVMDFIRAKRQDGRLRQFNLSVLITNEFMKAVENDLPWDLRFGGKTYRTVPARRLWDMIMSSTYDYAEPGFILIDHVNEMNNNWFCEDIRASNPCGEQMLPPGGSCLLGSVNLTKFVEAPFSDKARFNWERYREVVRVFTRMLDNVVEINGLPLEVQRDEITRKRRHGMGYLGLGSALTMLRIGYGSPEAIEFTSDVTKEMAVEGFRAGVELAQEKGPAPVFTETFTVSERMLARRPDLSDGLKLGAEHGGKELHVLSKYMERMPQDVRDGVLKHGCRFTHHTSIAPTGTISLALANNASNGIEPSFQHQYIRNVIRPGKKSKEAVSVCSFELLAYRHFVNPEASPDAENPENRLPDYFVSADAVDPKAHVAMQAAAQKWVDSSISKTINVPTEYPYEQFKDIYVAAYQMGLKGCTTFRYNPAAFQGVLVKEKDLENTVYRFQLDNGETVELKGNEVVEYEGETHTAANLFDALKEGYFGRY
jgi:ribonucleoside-diphosphate reductase alpha chain